MAWTSHHIENTTVAKCDQCGANAMAHYINTNKDCLRCHAIEQAAINKAAKDAAWEAMNQALNKDRKPIGELWTAVFGNDPFATK